MKWARASLSARTPADVILGQNIPSRAGDELHWRKRKSENKIEPFQAPKRRKFVVPRLASEGLARVCFRRRAGPAHVIMSAFRTSQVQSVRLYGERVSKRYTEYLGTVGNWSTQDWVCHLLFMQIGLNSNRIRAHIHVKLAKTLKTIQPRHDSNLVHGQVSITQAQPKS